MKFYAKNETPEQGKRLSDLAFGLVNTKCPLAITITNRPYAKLEYFGKWGDFKKLLTAHGIERYNFKERSKE